MMWAVLVLAVMFVPHYILWKQDSKRLRAKLDEPYKDGFRKAMCKMLSVRDMWF